MAVGEIGSLVRNGVFLFARNGVEGRLRAFLLIVRSWLLLEITSIVAKIKNFK